MGGTTPPSPHGAPDNNIHVVYVLITTYTLKSYYPGSPGETAVAPWHMFDCRSKIAQRKTVTDKRQNNN